MKMENTAEASLTRVQRHDDVSELASGAGISLLGKFAGRGLHVVAQVIIARLLGPALFGLYALGWTVVQVVGLIAPLGLDKGVIRYSSRATSSSPETIRGTFVQATGIALLTGFAVGICLFTGADWMAVEVFSKPALADVLRWFAIGLVGYAGLRVVAAATTVSKKMQYAVYSMDIAQPAFNLGLFLLLYVLGFRLMGAVVSATLSFIGAFLLAGYYLVKLYPEAFKRAVRPRYSSSRKLLAFSLPASMAGLVTMSNLWTDRLIVGYFLPEADVGVYYAASQIAILFAVILGAFGSILSPMIAEYSHSGEWRRLNEQFRVSTKWGLYLSLPAFLIICIAPQEVLTVIYGAEFEYGWTALLILSIGQLINVGTGNVGLLLVLSGHQRQWLFISFSVLILNISISWILVPRMGIAGAAVGTAISLCLLFGLGLWQTWRTMGLWPYDRRYMKGLAVALVTAAMLFLFRQLPVGGSFDLLVLLVLVDSIVYIFLLWRLGLDHEDHALLKLLQRKMPTVSKRC